MRRQGILPHAPKISRTRRLPCDACNASRARPQQTPDALTRCPRPQQIPMPSPDAHTRHARQLRTLGARQMRTPDALARRTSDGTSYPPQSPASPSASLGRGWRNAHLPKSRQRTNRVVRARGTTKTHAPPSANRERPARLPKREHRQTWTTPTTPPRFGEADMPHAWTMRGPERRKIEKRRKGTKTETTGWGLRMARRTKHRTGRPRRFQARP